MEKILARPERDTLAEMAAQIEASLDRAAGLLRAIADTLDETPVELWSDEEEQEAAR